MDAWGQTLAVLISNLPDVVEQPAETLVNYAHALDKFYSLIRCPNGFDSGTPTGYYTRNEYHNAIQQIEV